jgi:hypothetical protein
MRIDCHFHTSLHSCCSHVSPQRACEIAIERGLDALLFTEHGMYWKHEMLDAMQSLYPRIKLYSGIEIALTEGYHVVVFGKRILEQQTPVLTLKQLERLTRPVRRDIFLFVAHAFRYQPCPMPSLPHVLEACDGLEMNSINILRGHALINASRIIPDNHDLYQQYLQDYHLTPLYNTDGHDEDIIGLISNQFPTHEPPGNEVELARLFKTVQPMQFQDRDLLSRHSLLNTPEDGQQQID